MDQLKAPTFTLTWAVCRVLAGDFVVEGWTDYVLIEWNGKKTRNENVRTPENSFKNNEKQSFIYSFWFTFRFFNFIFVTKSFSLWTRQNGNLFFFVWISLQYSSYALSFVSDISPLGWHALQMSFFLKLHFKSGVSDLSCTVDRFHEDKALNNYCHNI